MGAKELEKAEQQGLLEFFKLVAKLNSSNMMYFDGDGETEPASEDEDAEDAEPDVNGDSLADYDYLLGMPIWSLTKEKIAKLDQQAGDKEKELLVLLEKTPIDLWNVDLDVFLKEWEVCGLLFLLLLFLFYFIQNALSLKRKR
jgi:DNA topoisomerase-2